VLVLFPLPQVEGGDAVPTAVNPVGVSVVAILLGDVINPGDTAGFVVIVPGVSALSPPVRLPLAA